MNLTKLKKFFIEHPSISIDALGQECGLPQSYMGKIINEKRPLTEANIERILPVVKKYGWK